MVKTRVEGNVIYVTWENAWRTLGIGLCILSLMLVGVHVSGAYGNPFTKEELRDEVRNRLLASGKYKESDIVELTCTYSSSGAYTVHVTFTDETIHSYQYDLDENGTAFVLADEAKKTEQKEKDRSQDTITVEDMSPYQD
ncbi:hypothetical protein [Aneurinibacillus uraniidurans]|uniref:hypothetical protein n=1 Tax=Aneurinibacillus uraniidurans TaxID=2966586 RepID=UPI002348F0F7|nr:hypothetical protein [Aneurinibacillus sp. B1]WCN39267.1 hypothetical protein PO771_07710 [Aneurinibacillus sp. B1]